MQSPSGGFFGSTYGESTTGYEHPPSKRHKALPKERPSTSAYDFHQRSTRGANSQGDPYQHYPPREAPRSSRSSFYSTESQPGPGYLSEYSIGQQRVESPSTGSPVTPQGSGWLSGFSQQQYGRPTAVHYPYRESGGQFGYGHGITTQPRQASQYVQPVPPERRLPSSTPNQYDNTRTYSQASRQGSYAMGTGYPQSYDDRRSGYGPSQAYLPAQDTLSQPPRTLPPPIQQPGSLPSIGPLSGTTSSSAFPISGTQQSAGTPTTSAGSGNGTQSYYYAQYQR